MDHADFTVSNFIEICIGLKMAKNNNLHISRDNSY